MSIVNVLGVTFVETWDSRKTTRSVDQQSIPLVFTAWGTSDENLLNLAFSTLVGTTFDGLPLDTITCDPKGGGVWICTALFSLRVPAASENQDDTEALGVAYAVDLTAGQIHITQSLETMGAVAVDGDPPDYKQAIGVTKDSVAGTDIFSPKFEFSLTVKTYPVTLDFLRTVRNVAARTNDAAWKGFEPGEVLYLGMTGQAQPDDYWTLTHKFAAGLNQTALVVSPEISVNKKAWEYLWCTYQYSTDAGVQVQTPNCAYVERVYEEANFDLLRLNPPVCNWTSTTPSGAHPLTVSFTDQSSNTPLTWAWDFGDGGTSSVANPSHIYTVPGVYSVSLTVANGAGSSFLTRTNYVTVG